MPTDYWWLQTYPFLWYVTGSLWLWCNHKNMMQLLSQV